MDRWNDALLAAALFAASPSSVRGVVVRSQCGPVRDAWLSYLQRLMPTTACRRVPLDVSEARLIGGIDLAATLATGLAIAERGLLAEAHGGVVILPSAERLEKNALAAISAAIDERIVRVERDGITAVVNANFGVVAFDESRDDEESVAAILIERLPLVIDLDGIPLKTARVPAISPDAIKTAHRSAESITIVEQDAEAICATADALGITSSRLDIQALVVARINAAIHNRNFVGSDDLEAAVRLVLAPRATKFPDFVHADAQTPPPQSEAETETHPGKQEQDELSELLLAAAKATLPERLLEALRRDAGARKSKTATGRAGAMRKAQKTRGRRAGSRRGDPRTGGRVDVLETIRAAAPWQPLRRRERQTGVNASRAAPRLEIRPSDFRLRTFKHQSETATIFVVDASGSAALHRLAEAKGAVELLLADCYARRDHVALIAFRGKSAEVLLPPTRSLVRAKRSLAGLPGGGGTPLAMATDQACTLAMASRRKGQSPTVVFLTDGRANINRGGTPGRAAAELDAHAAAQLLKAERISALVIDTSPHPGKDSRCFADKMGAKYLPLPHADAATLSTAIRHAAT